MLVTCITKKSEEKAQERKACSAKGLCQERYSSTTPGTGARARGHGAQIFAQAPTKKPIFRLVFVPENWAWESWLKKALQNSL